MVTYNRLDLTKETLDYIWKNTKYPFHLAIVDNGSTDGTVEFLKEEIEKKPAGLRLDGPQEFFVESAIQYNAENKGIAPGRNQALKLAEKWSDPWLSTFDNDVYVPDGWLKEAINIMTKNPQYGMIGVNMENVTYPMVNLNDQEFQEKPRGNLGTACTVFPRSLHKMLGYFCKSFEFYGHEDADFGFRTRVLGLKLGYIKENGKHLGEGEQDKGAYREFKNKYGKENLPKFHQNCSDYYNKKKSLYIPYKE